MATMKHLSLMLIAAVPMVLNAPSAAQAFSLVSTSTGQVGAIDPATGSFTHLTTGPSFLDIALSNEGNLFGVSSKLYKFDQSLGLFSEIGNVGASLNALGFSTNNILYGAEGSNFYTVDILTGSASLIANIPGFLSAGDIVFDPSNNRFLATSSDTVSDSLFSIDITGKANKIGNIGFRSVLGLFFDNGTLFGYTGDQKQLIINPVTGLGTFDKDVTGASGNLYGAASLPSTSVPEPTTILGTLAFSTFAVRWRMKRKQQQKLLDSKVA